MDMDLCRKVVEFFNLTKRECNVFKTAGISNLESLLVVLEQYKFREPVDICQFLNELDDSYIYCHLENFDAESDFTAMEDKLQILIRKDSNKSVKVFIPHSCRDFTEEVLAINLSFYAYEIFHITDYNYQQIMAYRNDKKIAFDSDIMFKRVLLEAIDLQATDIHFTVKHLEGTITYPIQYRRNGLLFTMQKFDLDGAMNKDIAMKLIETKTNRSSVDISGSEGIVSNVSDILHDGTIELRVSVVKVKDGYMTVVRIQQKSTTSFTIDQLGFDKTVLRDIQRLAEKHNGITLITGAIRTGKNTTALAMANEIIKSPVCVVSYDSPIEVIMPYPQIDYMEEDKRLIRYVEMAKKQDVDIVFINEVPTKGVAQAVQDLANSSVGVITTFHLNRLWDLPYRLEEYYGDRYKFVISQINGIVNQKMFGVLCKNCRCEMLVQELPNSDIKNFLVEHGVHKIFESRGCTQCTDPITKISGQIIGKNQPYAEHLVFTDTIKNDLMQCRTPWDMSLYLKRQVKDLRQDLETYMLAGISQGELSYKALSYII